MGFGSFKREPQSARKTTVATLVSVLQVTIVLLALGYLAYRVADQIYWRKVQEMRLDFKERYGAVDFRDFIPERPPANEDAARVYQYAAGLAARAGVQNDASSPFRSMLLEAGASSARTADSASLPPRTVTEAQVQAAAPALEKVWPVLRKADTKEGGVLTRFHEPGKTSAGPDELQSLAELMAIKAILEARGGNVDEAARWLESGMHLADLLRREPTISAQMLRIYCLKANTIALQEVLNAGAEVPVLSEAYFEQWEQAAEPTWFVRGMASELGLYWSMETPGLTRLRRSMLTLELGEWFDRIVTAIEMDATYAGNLRPFLNMGLPGSLAHGTSGPAMALNQIAMELMPLATRERSVGPWRGAEPAAFSNLLAAYRYFELPVRRDQVRLALALRRFHAARGGYPETLDGLVPEFIDVVPVDPTTGRTMTYMQENGLARLESPGLLEVPPWEFTLK